MKWQNRKDGIKIAKGKGYHFAYQKANTGKNYLLLIEDQGLCVKLNLKTEADCKIVAKLLNK